MTKQAFANQAVQTASRALAPRMELHPTIRAPPREVANKLVTMILLRGNPAYEPTVRSRASSKV